MFFQSSTTSRLNKNLSPRQTAIALFVLAVIWSSYFWNSYPTLLPASQLRLSRKKYFTDHPDELVEVRMLTPNSKVAFATFLGENTKRTSEDEKDDDDMYYVATRVLIYQLLHDPDTGTKKGIPVVVLTTKEVRESKREQLSRDGAIIVVAEDIPLPFWVSTGVTRWKDQFIKLRLLELIEFERIAFLDADTVLTKSLDGVFEQSAVITPAETLFWQRDSEIKKDEVPLPDRYVFAARPDNALNGEREHPFPPIEGSIFSAGFWVAAPSFQIFDYYYSVVGHWRRFDPFTMEQSMLNYAHRLKGAMPWGRLDYHWSATWPNLEDLKGGVASLHEKFWTTGPDEIRQIWFDARAKMEEFWKQRRKEEEEEDDGHEHDI